MQYSELPQSLQHASAERKTALPPEKTQTTSISLRGGEERGERREKKRRENERVCQFLSSTKTTPFFLFEATHLLFQT